MTPNGNNSNQLLIATSVALKNKSCLLGAAFILRYINYYLAGAAAGFVSVVFLVVEEVLAGFLCFLEDPFFAGSVLAVAVELVELLAGAAAAG